MIPTLETERLLLQPLRLSDADQTQRLFPSWEIVRFLNASVPWPYPADGAFTYYRDVSLPAIEQGVEWHWTLRLKTSPELHIGTILLADQANDNRGFWLGLPWQRCGFMTEAVMATTAFWFGNVASRRLSQSAGMRIVATEPHNFVSGELLSEVWQITADEWLYS
jgi:ribosomal-protein-alanine N-acetyltransferase